MRFIGSRGGWACAAANLLHAALPGMSFGGSENLDDESVPAPSLDSAAVPSVRSANRCEAQCFGDGARRRALYDRRHWPIRGPGDGKRASDAGKLGQVDGARAREADRA